MFILVFFPHCGEINKNYTGSTIVEDAYPSSVDNCTKDCEMNADCFNWVMETSSDQVSALTCELRGEIPSSEAPVDIVEAGKYYLWGSQLCVKTYKSIPALPEDAEELSYKEICTKEQYDEMIRVNNTWNKVYCPSKKDTKFINYGHLN
jgi:hypothetical protein